VLTAHMTPFVKTTEIFDKHKKFWIEHDITVIPHEILIDIRKLGDYQIIENPSEEYFDVSVFLQNLSTAKTVKGLSHAVHPRFPEFFMNLAKKGVTSSLIFTPGVVKILKEKYPGWIEEFLSLEKTSLYATKKDIKFSYAVSDTYFSISLFFSSGTFDTMNDLTSHDPSAIEWGERIFEYLLEQSEKIDSSD
jgi:predicted transcriptional regulator